MTYCLGMKLDSGLVGIADTRITSGTETTTARKIYINQKKNHSMFIMTSGLRSIRDKALTYFREEIEEHDESFNKLYKAVNAFGRQLRNVYMEDRDPLKEAGLNFNMYTIVGGQLQDDEEHNLFLIYPEGNWVEVSKASPYFIIGNSGHGKPILNRVLNHDISMEMALKAGFLSFDSTRVSANDVEFPIDVLLYKKDTFQIVEHRYEKADLQGISEKWAKELTQSVNNISDDWMSSIFQKLPA